MDEPLTFKSNAEVFISGNEKQENTRQSKTAQALNKMPGSTFHRSRYPSFTECQWVSAFNSALGGLGSSMPIEIGHVEGIFRYPNMTATIDNHDAKGILSGVLTL